MGSWYAYDTIGRDIRIALRIVHETRCGATDVLLGRSLVKLQTLANGAMEGCEIIAGQIEKLTVLTYALHVLATGPPQSESQISQICFRIPTKSNLLYTKLFASSMDTFFSP